MANLILKADHEIVRGYKLKQALGKSRLGSVWEAEGPNGESFALKILPTDAGSTRSEMRAIQMIGAFRHPNLTPAEQVWSLEGHIIVAMKMADGSLRDMLEVYLGEFGTGIEGPQLCSMLAQAAKGIDYLNAKQHMFDGQKVGLQHSNIKPGNLLLYGDTVRLSDFGFAVPSSASLKLQRRLGTLDYAPQEVFRARLSDSADQFSLAITYFQLRIGQLPYPETPAQVGADYFRPEPNLSPLPDAERAIIARALHKVPMQRWPNCSEMMAQLGKVVT